MLTCNIENKKNIGNLETIIGGQLYYYGIVFKRKKRLLQVSFDLQYRKLKKKFILN